MNAIDPEKNFILASTSHRYNVEVMRDSRARASGIVTLGFHSVFHLSFQAFLHLYQPHHPHHYHPRRQNRARQKLHPLVNHPHHLHHSYLKLPALLAMSLIVCAFDYDDVVLASMMQVANWIHYYFAASFAEVVSPSEGTARGGALYSLRDEVEIATLVVFANMPEGILIPSQT